MNDFEIEEQYKTSVYNNMKTKQTKPIKLIAILIDLKIAKDEKQANFILFSLVCLLFVATGIIIFENVKPKYIKVNFSEEQKKAFPIKVQERMNQNEKK